MASAMGLRQVLPVHTKRMMTLDVSASVAASINARTFDAPAIVVDANHSGEILIMRGSGVDDHVQPGQSPQ